MCASIIVPLPYSLLHIPWWAINKNKGDRHRMREGEERERERERDPLIHGSMYSMHAGPCLWSRWPDIRFGQTQICPQMCPENDNNDRMTKGWSWKKACVRPECVKIVQYDDPMCFSSQEMKDQIYCAKQMKSKVCTVICNYDNA